MNMYEGLVLVFACAYEKAQRFYIVNQNEFMYIQFMYIQYLTTFSQI